MAVKLKSGELPKGVYALIDDSIATHRTLIEKIEAAILAKVPLLQLRLKKTSDREIVELTRKAVEMTGVFRAFVILNDRVDLALIASAHGVHLGSDDIPVSVARDVLGASAIVGATVRHQNDIVSAHKARASYVGLGPVFSTTTKKLDVAAIGIEGFKKTAKDSALPVAAIGGLQIDHCAALRQSGAHWVTVASAWQQAPNMTTALQQLSEAFFKE